MDPENSPQEPTLKPSSAPTRWQLEAPDWGVLDTIWRSPMPFILWPVCEKPLLAYWLDEAVRRGVSDIRFVCIDRPHLVRNWLDQQDLWSRRSIEVLSAPEPAGDRQVFEMDRLPGQAFDRGVDSPRDLLRRWFALHGEAIARRASSPVHLDREIAPGVWVGPGASVPPDAKLSAPCWIGAYAKVGAHAKLGPGAFVGPGAYLDEDVEVVSSIVCADTYVGRHTTLENMVVQGALLLDIERGLGVEISDQFVLSSLVAGHSSPTLPERAAAWLLRPFLEAAAKLAAKGEPPARQTFRVGRSQSVELLTYPAGPLILRRSPWLRAVAAGHLRWLGVLPRSEEDWANLPPDARATLEAAPAGVLALSDLYHCHSAAQPDEWVHALFQAASPDGAGQKIARKSLAKIAFMDPVQR